MRAVSFRRLHGEINRVADLHFVVVKGHIDFGLVIPLKIRLWQISDFVAKRQKQF
jgi:hypothetical protein